VSFEEFNDIVDLQRYDELDAKLAPDQSRRGGKTTGR
jgi:hypothetical protein